RPPPQPQPSLNRRRARPSAPRPLSLESRKAARGRPFEFFPNQSLGVFFLYTGLETGAGQRPAKAPLSTRSSLRIDDLAIAIDDDVDGIAVRGVHGGKIRVPSHHDVTLARMLFQILLHDLLGFAYIHREHDQAF